MTRRNIDPQTIVYVEGADNYCVFQLTTGRRELYAGSVTVFHRLYPNLIRIHRRHLVNPEHVIYHRQGYTNCRNWLAYVTVVGGKRIHVSRRRRDQLNKLLS